MEKTCPKCHSSHTKDGTFCSRKCANSRDHSDEVKRKISAGVKSYLNDLPEEERKALADVRIERIKAVNSDPSIKLKRTSRAKKTAGPILRYQVLTEQDHKCNRCKLDSWLGEPITLELEHKDGDNQNNSRDNLEFLCPNCHSLTPTWRGRNKRGTLNSMIPVEGYRSIRQYLIAQGLTPKGRNYALAKKRLGL